MSTFELTTVPVQYLVGSEKTIPTAELADAWREFSEAIVAAGQSPGDTSCWEVYVTMEDDSSDNASAVTELYWPLAD